MVNDQIQGTLDFIAKIEAALQVDLQMYSEDNLSPLKDIDGRRFSAYKTLYGRGDRGKSADQRKMDTTIMSEMEYINILPDIEKLEQEMDDSSFLKGSFVDKTNRNH